MPSDFETDDAGNLVLKPVTGWTSAEVAGIGVLLAIQFADTPAQLEKDECSRLQLYLTPQQCLELSERLTKLARHLLRSDLPLGKSPN